MPQLAGVLFQRSQRRVGVFAAERQYEGGGVAQVGGGADFRHGDGEARQLWVMRLAAHQHIGESPPDRLADFQLSLARRAAAVLPVSMGFPFAHLVYVAA